MPIRDSYRDCLEGTARWVLMSCRDSRFGATDTAVALIVGIVAIGLPPAASAAPPDIVRSADNEGYIAGVQDCGDGTRVDISFVFDEAADFFYDQSGELVRVTRWSKGAGTLLLIDEETEEVLATETGASPSMEIFDLRNGTASVVGMTLHNNVPGSGRVAHAAGIFRFELLSFEVVSGRAGQGP